MLKRLTRNLSLSLALYLVPLCGADSLSGVNYIIIDYGQSFAIALASQFSFIRATLDRSLDPPQYVGNCTNTLVLSANVPVLLNVTLADHAFTQDDQLQLRMSPPNNGLSRSLMLWDGSNPAVNEQLAQDIQGEQLEFQLMMTYSGSMKTPLEQKRACVYYTIFADDEL
jgi:hypothetical protein